MLLINCKVLTFMDEIKTLEKDHVAVLSTRDGTENKKLFTRLQAVDLL